MPRSPSIGSSRAWVGSCSSNVRRIQSVVLATGEGLLAGARINRTAGHPLERRRIMPGVRYGLRASGGDEPWE